MNKLERFSPALLPLTGAIPQLVKEETILSPDGLTAVKIGLAVIAAALLLGEFALNNRQMEAAHKRDRILSRASTALKSAGVGALLYGIWQINSF